MIALIAVAVLVSRRQLLDALLVVVALVGAEVIDAAVKDSFERERPIFADPIARRASGFSFPSAHAGASMALYGALAFLLSRDRRSTRMRVGCFVGAALLVGAIGFSRLYLGAHYLSDVLAGFTLGLGWATFVVLLIGRAVNEAKNILVEMPISDVSSVDVRTGALASEVRWTAPGRQYIVAAKPDEAARLARAVAPGA